MKPTDVKPRRHIDSGKEINDKDPKFKTGDIVRKSKYKSIFPKGYVPNRSEKVFVITKVKNIVPWTYVISDLNGEESVGTLYKKKIAKTKSKRIYSSKSNKEKMWKTIC